MQKNGQTGSRKSNPNYTYLKSAVPQQRVTLLQGGTRSGKTWAIIYYIIWLCDQHEGMEIDIVRDTFTALKATVWKDFKQILVDMGEYNVTNHNKTDHIYYLHGNTITYYGADDPQKIHGRSRDIIWINEANHLDEETVDQLLPRTRHRVIADYNPALPQDHWLDNYITDFAPFITTYRDNPHLTQAQVADIESKQKNAYWWSVYGLGERARPVGAIFTNWRKGEFDKSLPLIYGMDFGYSVDPSTLVRMAVDHKRKVIYCEELMYEAGLSTSEIYTRTQLHTEKSGLIIADSAEPRLIDELKHKGLNIKATGKGPDSVRAGLMKMQDYEIIVSDGANLTKELNNYVWSDKKSATPVDRDNHLIDAMRYAFMYLTDNPNKGNYMLG